MSCLTGLTLKKNKCEVFYKTGTILGHSEKGGLAACEDMWSLKNAENLASEAIEMGGLRMKSFAHHVMHSNVFSFCLGLGHLGESREP